MNSYCLSKLLITSKCTFVRCIGVTPRIAALVWFLPHFLLRGLFTMGHQFNTVAHTCQKYRKTFQWSSMWKWKPEHCRKSMVFFKWFTWFYIYGPYETSIYVLQFFAKFNSRAGVPLKKFYFYLFIWTKHIRISKICLYRFQLYSSLIGMCKN